ncbi:MAG: DoxX family protein [Bacteroidales bacterium]|nr:DoxX family protein [Bacteroidales bacterium]
MKNEKTIQILVTISRWIVGATFLFSSFSKGVDPLGTSYKIQEYMTAWSVGSLSFDWALPLATFLSIAMITLEFLVGVLLITNCYKKLAAWILMLMMIFFTVTTFIDAVTNKVTDCGCFGDLVKLTNWETFWKNVVLMVFTVIIFIYRNIPKKKKTFERDFIISLFAIAIMIAFQLYNIANEPILDFRAWKVGNRMMPEEKGEIKTFLIYKNKTTNDTIEFTSEKLMDYYKDSEWVANWEFVDSKMIDPNEIYADGFSMMDADGTDFAKDIISSPDPVLIATIHHLNDVNEKGKRSLQRVNNYAKNRGIYFVILVATTSTQEEITNFLFENKIDNTEVYYTDEKAIETMLRSNPGFILLKDSKVIGKWHYNNHTDLLKIEKENL